MQLVPEQHSMCQQATLRWLVDSTTQWLAGCCTHRSTERLPCLPLCVKSARCAPGRLAHQCHPCLPACDRRQRSCSSTKACEQRSKVRHSIQCTAACTSLAYSCCCMQQATKQAVKCHQMLTPRMGMNCCCYWLTCRAPSARQSPQLARLGFRFVPAPAGVAGHQLPQLPAAVHPCQPR